MMHGKISAAAARPLISAILVADGGPGDISALSDAYVNAIDVETHVDFASVHRAVCEAHAKIDKEKRVKAEQKLQDRAQRVADVLTSRFGASLRVGRFSFDPSCDGEAEPNRVFVAADYTLIFESAIEGLGVQHEITSHLRYAVTHGELGSVTYSFWEYMTASVVHMTKHTAHFLGAAGRNYDVLYTFLAQLHRAMGIPDDALRVENVLRPQIALI